MSHFDRLGWLCSWVAPSSWITALLAFLVAVFVERQGAPVHGLQTALPGIVFIAASLGLAAQTILAFHVARASTFSSEERRALFRDLWLGFGYQRWRSTVRAARRP
jgi:hypothetical protein